MKMYNKNCLERKLNALNYPNTLEQAYSTYTNIKTHRHLVILYFFFSLRKPNEQTQKHTRKDYMSKSALFWQNKNFFLLVVCLLVLLASLFVVFFFIVLTFTVCCAAASLTSSSDAEELLTLLQLLARLLLGTYYINVFCFHQIKASVIIVSIWPKFKFTIFFLFPNIYA